eukprot:scaffold1734_cov64-Cyclotella_meneghiniana.AAC.3
MTTTSIVKASISLDNGDVYEIEGCDALFYKFADGDIFKVEFDDNEKSIGRGTWWYADGYEMRWNNDGMNGRGEIEFSNNDIYVGECRNGEPNGDGVMKYANGDEYVGIFNHGKADGIGLYKYSNGNLFEGLFKDGDRNGKGVERLSNGCIIEGEWKDGELYGEAFFKSSSGNVWVMKTSCLVQIADA